MRWAMPLLMPLHLNVLRSNLTNRNSPSRPAMFRSFSEFQSGSVTVCGSIESPRTTEKNEVLSVVAAYFASPAELELS